MEQNNAPDLANMDLDALLEGSMEDLLDMKEFKPLPVGRYLMNFDWEPSEEPAGIRFIFQVAEILELANPEEAEEVEIGYKWYQLQAWLTKEGKPSEFGQGRVKQLCALVQPIFGGNNIKEILDNAVGAQFVVQTLQRRDKKDRDVIYDGVKSIELYDPADAE